MDKYKFKRLKVNFLLLQFQTAAINKYKLTPVR